MVGAPKYNCPFNYICIIMSLFERQGHGHGALELDFSAFEMDIVYLLLHNYGEGGVQEASSSKAQTQT